MGIGMGMKRLMAVMTVSKMCNVLILITIYIA